MNCVAPAMSSTSGPTRIPSRISTTTTGGTSRPGTEATVRAAIAATATMMKNDAVSMENIGPDPALC